MSGGRIQRKDIIHMYGISRDTIERAVNKGELVFNCGWIGASEVAEWALKKNYKRVDIGALADLDLKVDGGGLLPEDLLSKVEKMSIPPELVKAATDGKDVAQSLVAIVKSQEGQLKMFKESGRLADLNETQACFDATIAAMVTAAQGLSKELSADIARTRKLKVGDVRTTLDDASDHLIRVLEACKADAEKRVQAFQDQKAAELKTKKHRS